MAFVDDLKGLATRAEQLKGHLETEEATKMALVAPFIQTLGYNIFDPTEVVPEFTADIGSKKGEKVDYAIKVKGEVAILIEAKPAFTELSDAHKSQLYRYFTAVTGARIALLTNGLVYRFYSDLEQPNVMDQSPFLEIDLRSLREDALAELRKMTKDEFDLEAMISTATDLRDLNIIMATFTQQFDEPDDEFVRLFYAKAHANRSFTAARKGPFTALVKRGFAQFIREKVGAGLDAQLGHVSPSQKPPEPPPVPEESEPENGIVTTEEELEAFRVVRAIVCGELPISRVGYRDYKAFMVVLVDDSNRRPLCRFYFNKEPKFLGLLGDDKTERREQIQTPDDIYRFSDELRAAARRYAAPAASQPDNGGAPA